MSTLVLFLGFNKDPFDDRSLQKRVSGAIVVVCVSTVLFAMVEMLFVWNGLMSSYEDIFFARTLGVGFNFVATFFWPEVLFWVKKMKVPKRLRNEVSLFAIKLLVNASIYSISGFGTPVKFLVKVCVALVVSFLFADLIKKKLQPRVFSRLFKQSISSHEARAQESVR